jgi:glucose-1-phosphate thymidylyltransferase
LLQRRFEIRTHESLLKAAAFVETIEERQGTMIACLEEIALNNGWIDSAVLHQQIDAMGTNAYTDYLRSLVDGWGNGGL